MEELGVIFLGEGRELGMIDELVGGFNPFEKY